MKKRFSNKTDLILGIILTVICLVGLYAYNKSYNHQTEVIERDGITVVGEVVEKGRSKHRRGDNTYTIKYKFEYQGENGRRISADQALAGVALAGFAA